MSLLDRKRSVLIVIDLQGKLMEMIYRPALVVETNRRLLKLAELFQVPVLITEQYPKGLGPTHPQIWQQFEQLTVPKRHLEKTSFGCCGDPEFFDAIAQLRPHLEAGQRQLLIAGIEAHVCVMQTVIELLAGHEQVYLCWDAISGRGEEYRHYALERMRRAGAIITNHESVGFEWSRDKNHPAFKELNRLLKDGQPQ